MNFNDYYYRQHFEDRAGTHFPDYLVYTGSIYSDGHYVTASLPISASTPATQRLGNAVIQGVQPINKVYENTGVGGTRVGPVTMFDSLETTNDISIRTLDAHRVGRNIKIYDHWASPIFRPILRISPEGFLEEEGSAIINHYASLNMYGFGLNYKTKDENYKFIPFTDFSQIEPKRLVEVGGVLNLAYPFVYENDKNLEHYVDPSHPGNDGSVDVFETRLYATTLSPADIRIFGFKSNLQGGGIESIRKGTSQIVSRYSTRKNNNELFLDSQETEFNSFTFPSIGSAGSSGYAFPLPGFVDAEKASLSPFDESYDPIGQSYTFVSNNVASTKSFLTSSRNRISELGTRFKSATNGLIFGESNVLGTDSIAFGGLKK
jgi:hypothetical protein